MKKLVFVLPLLAVAGCTSTAPAPTFAPLQYSYLPPILLKVSQVNVTDGYVPTPSQVKMAGLDPAAPDETLLAMLKQRLQPAGQAGTATVTVEAAYVDDVNGTLVGQMTVNLNLASADGLSTGFTEASVSATETAPDSGNPDDMRAALYDLTKRLMTQMNVELQYEIQKNLPNWISWTGTGTFGASQAATGAVGTGVQVAPLAPPPGAAPASSTTNGQAVQPAPASSHVNPTVPAYLPGAGPAALTNGQNNGQSN